MLMSKFHVQETVKKRRTLANPKNERKCVCAQVTGTKELSLFGCESRVCHYHVRKHFFLCPTWLLNTVIPDKIKHVIKLHCL